MRTTAVRALATATAFAALVSACRGPAPPDIVVGAGTTIEQRVLASLSVLVLESGGISTRVEPVAGGTVGLRREAVRGNIGLFWDYTGAAWALGMGEHAPPADPDESYARVRAADERNDLVWLPPTTANATLALFVRPEEGVRDMSEAAALLSGGRALCADPDFIDRSGGLEALVLAYDIGEGLAVKAAPEDEAIRRVAGGTCFAGLATATSGEAWLEGLTPVRDDLRIFPAFIAAPVVRRTVHGRTPEVESLLNAVTERLDTATLGALNAAVARGQTPEEVAEQYLRGLPPTPEGTAEA